MNYMQDIYRLAHIKRYSNIITHHEESVAEHAFFVAALLMDLHDRYIFDLGKALQIAISHDMPEIELNDCPHSIKRDYPEIKKAYDICEDKVLKTLPKSVQYGILEYDVDESIEAHIVHYADALQCLQYAEAEIELGNHGYMPTVIHESQLRMEKIHKQLLRR